MRNVFAFCAKELKVQFASPIAYVVLTGFVMLAGFFFFDLFSNFSRVLSYASSYQDPRIFEQVNLNDLVLTPLFQNMNVLLLLVIPLITMRAFAEEKRHGTDELILTSPVGIAEVVWGKFLAAFGFYLVLLALTIQYPIILAYFGEIDPGKVAAGYLGLLLMGTAFLSLGLFASTLTRSQMVAAIGAFSALLVFWIVGWMAESVFGLAGDVLKFLSLTEHFEAFAKGSVDTKDLVFFVSFIFFFLFLSTRSVESTRWR